MAAHETTILLSCGGPERRKSADTSDHNFPIDSFRPGSSTPSSGYSYSGFEDMYSSEFSFPVSSTPSSEFDWPSHSHTSHSSPTSEFATLEMTSPALYPSPPADWDPSLASMLSAFEAAPPDFLGNPPQNPLDDYFALLDSSLPLPDPGLRYVGMNKFLEALHYHLFQLARPDPTLSIESNPPQFSEPQDLNSGVTVESGAMESASVRAPLSPRRSARKRAASTVHSDAPPSKIISAELSGVPVITADSGRSFEFLAQFPGEYRSLYGDAETA
ncbi:hypothetical protein K438DRAFT_1779438 [Mycena galopus ATCC 62051]|nr:hypothetical protein K438DRAFT_1779438 [Mycena galopus ATCC 62051]